MRRGVYYCNWSGLLSSLLLMQPPPAELVCAILHGQEQDKCTFGYLYNAGDLELYPYVVKPTASGLIRSSESRRSLLVQVFCSTHVSGPPPL